MKTLAITWGVIVLLIALLVFGLFKAGYRNVGMVKQHAETTFEQVGYEVVGYQGYEWSPLGGGMVWYVLHKKPDNGVVYQAAVEKWGDEFHIYYLKAIDALKPISR